MDDLEVDALRASCMAQLGALIDATNSNAGFVFEGEQLHTGGIEQLMSSKNPNDWRPFS